MAHKPAYNAISEPKSPNTLDHIKRQLAFSQSIIRQDAKGLQNKQPKQPTALSPQDKLKQYLSKPPVNNIAYKADPITQWKDISAMQFPQLSYIAINFLTIASSSAKTKRDFNSCRRLITPFKYRLQRHIVNIAQCLQSQSKASTSTSRSS